MPNTDIHEAGFSIRTLNVLKNVNHRIYGSSKGNTIETLKDLSGFSEKELSRLKGCGIHTIMEIRNKLQDAGLIISKESNRGHWDVYGWYS